MKWWWKSGEPELSRKNNAQKPINRFGFGCVLCDDSGKPFPSLESIPSLVKSRVWTNRFLRFLPAQWFCQLSFGYYTLHLVTWVKIFPWHHFSDTKLPPSLKTSRPPHTSSKSLHYCISQRYSVPQGTALKEGPRKRKKVPQSEPALFSCTHWQSFSLQNHWETDLQSVAKTVG